MPFRVLASLSKTCQVLPSLCKSVRVFPSLAKSCQVCPGLARACQVLSMIVKSCQVPASLLKSCQVLRRLIFWNPVHPSSLTRGPHLLVPRQPKFANNSSRGKSYEVSVSRGLSKSRKVWRLHVIACHVSPSPVKSCQISPSPAKSCLFLKRHILRHHRKPKFRGPHLLGPRQPMFPNEGAPPFRAHPTQAPQTIQSCPALPSIPKSCQVLSCPVQACQVSPSLAKSWRVLPSLVKA